LIFYYIAKTNSVDHIQPAKLSKKYLFINQEFNSGLR